MLPILSQTVAHRKRSLICLLHITVTTKSTLLCTFSRAERIDTLSPLNSFMAQHMGCSGMENSPSVVLAIGVINISLCSFLHLKGDQSWVFIGRTDVEAETPILWPPDVKS